MGKNQTYLYFCSCLALNSANRKNAKMTKLNISGLTSVREMNINIESRKDIIIGQNALDAVDNRLAMSFIHRRTSQVGMTCEVVNRLLTRKNKSKNEDRTTNILSKIRPVNPPKLKTP